MHNCVIFRLTDSYLAAIRNSIGSQIFRDVFADVNGKRTNVTRHGTLSCASFVSGILTMFGCIQRMHTTVDGMVRDLEHSGWKRIRRPRAGCVLVWEERIGHKHIGFSIGNNKAISNSTARSVPVAHHWTFGTREGKPVRRVTALYWLPRLR